MKRWYLEKWQQLSDDQLWSIRGFYHSEGSARAAKRRHEKSEPGEKFRTRSVEVKARS